MKLIDRHSLQEKLLMSRSALYVAMDKGELPKPIKFGKKMLWSEGEIDAIIAKKLNDQSRYDAAETHSESA